MEKSQTANTEQIQFNSSENENKDPNNSKTT